ncbi:MAG: hypothetical protein AB7S75_21710 [Desulfococcaceae bacterium]
MAFAIRTAKFGRKGILPFSNAERVLIFSRLAASLTVKPTKV